MLPPRDTSVLVGLILNSQGGGLVLGTPSFPEHCSVLPYLAGVIASAPLLLQTKPAPKIIVSDRQPQKNGCDALVSHLALFSPISDLLLLADSAAKEAPLISATDDLLDPLFHPITPFFPSFSALFLLLLLLLLQVAVGTALANYSSIL